MKKPKAPDFLYAVVVTDHSGIIFSQKTYAMKEAAEHRRCGEPAYVVGYKPYIEFPMPRVRKGKRTTPAKPDAGT